MNEQQQGQQVETCEGCAEYREAEARQVEADRETEVGMFDLWEALVKTPNDLTGIRFAAEAVVDGWFDGRETVAEARQTKCLDEAAKDSTCRSCPRPEAVRRLSGIYREILDAYLDDDATALKGAVATLVDTFTSEMIEHVKAKRAARAARAATVTATA